MSVRFKFTSSQQSGLGWLLCLVLCLTGCSGGSSGTAENEAASKEQSVAKKPKKTAKTETVDESYQPIALSGGSATGGSSDGSPNMNEPPKREDVVKGLQPIQKVLVGKWNGLLKKGAAQEVHQWLWDFTTDKVFPALVVQAPEGKFFTEARLTFDPRTKKYLMKTTDRDSKVHKYEGEFLAEPQDVPGDDPAKTERTFKLQLTELEVEGEKEHWQYLLNQQSNSRYILEVSRKRGKGMFAEVDRIGTQKEGTSFARADEDYGDKTCIISEGLGTSTVSFEGKSYYVCCSGCAAAFKDDPKGWIAKFEARKAAKK